MNGKTLLIIGASFFAGFYICKKRLAKKSATDSETAANAAVDEATTIFDNLLAQAEKMNMSIHDLRQHLNQPA